MASSWSESLESARTEKEIVAVVRDFVASFDAQEIQRLPEECRPGKFFNAEDVTSLAFDLVRAECHSDDGAKDSVLKLSVFFAQASIRLSQVLARASTSDGQEGQRSA